RDGGRGGRADPVGLRALPRADEAMSTVGPHIAGPLADHPLPLVLHQLYQAEASGVLTLSARAGQHEVFFRAGYPVAVDLPGSAELLGKVLLDTKVIDEATYKRSLTEPPPPGKRYGDVLLEKKWVTEEQLRLALKAQVRRKLHRLFFLSDGTV